MTDISIYIIKPYFNSFCVYWGLSLIYFLCDIFIDEKYRMEGNIDWKLYKKTFYHVLYLQFCFSLPVMYFMIPLWKWRGNSILYEELEYIEIPKLTLNIATSSCLNLEVRCTLAIF